jgi:Cu+-exporting ATPase
LIKDAQALETARAIRLVAFDKTGTLTQGRPTLTLLEPYRIDRAAALALAAAVQAGSEHALGRAVVRAAQAEGVPVVPALSILALPGQGIQGVVNGRMVLIGADRLMTARGVDCAALHDAAQAQVTAGRSVSWVAELTPEPRLLALLAFGDTVKPTAAVAVARLKAEGIRVAMVTGDNEGSAAAVARDVGIDMVSASVLPEGKAQAIAAWRRTGAVVAMVGDGINDAPALAAADIGIAMSTGADVALEAAAITLMRGDPAFVVDAIDIARRTSAKIRQGLFWAFLYNIVAIPLAVGGQLTPVVAGAAMALSSLSVVANALLLRRWRPRAAA